MKSFISIFVTFCLLNGTNCKIFVNDEHMLIIPFYVSEVIKMVTDRDVSRYYDVVLIRLEIESKSRTFDDISRMITKQNSNAVLIHDTDNSLDHRCIPSASVIVIVTDYENPVSFNYSPSKQKFKVACSRLTCVTQSSRCSQSISGQTQRSLLS